jgi:hypothetical protein
VVSSSQQSCCFWLVFAIHIESRYNLAL